MTTPGEILQALAKGLGRTSLNFISGVLSLALLLIFVMVAAEYRANEKIGEERAAEEQEARDRSAFENPPSQYDGWGDDAVGQSQ